jgi:hypothetical protein
VTITTEEIYDGPLYEAAKKVYPQKVWGIYRRIKWIVLWIALGVYYILPFIRWNRGPNAPNQAVLVDIAHSRFYAFFIELWPQEVYYFTGLLILASLPVQCAVRARVVRLRLSADGLDGPFSLGRALHRG